MSGKDFITLLLCLYGYDRDIDVKLYRGEYNCYGYDIYAKNKDGDEYINDGCEGLTFYIRDIISYMEDRGVSPYDGILDTHYSLNVKDFLNEDTRNRLLKQYDNLNK